MVSDFQPYKKSCLRIWRGSSCGKDLELLYADCIYNIPWYCLVFKFIRFLTLLVSKLRPQWLVFRDYNSLCRCYAIAKHLALLCLAAKMIDYNINILSISMTHKISAGCHDRSIYRSLTVVSYNIQSVWVSDVACHRVLSSYIINVGNKFGRHTSLRQRLNTDDWCHWRRL